MTETVPASEGSNVDLAGVPGQRQALEPSLRGRVPGQAVIEALLAEQQQTPPRSRLARLLGASPLNQQAHLWYSGALGEIVVGRLLARLGPEWVVLHAVPVGDRGSDIDHVLIGPGGVFTVNTKHHAGQRVWVAGSTFMVAGQKQQHIRNAEHEASRVARLLAGADAAASRFVRPLVVVVNPKQLTVKTKPTEVVVLTSAQLLRWLKRQPKVLDAGAVARLAVVAERPSTWRKAAVLEKATDSGALQTDFDSIRKRVRGARRVRLAWGFGAYASIAAGGLTYGPELLTGLMRASMP